MTERKVLQTLLRTMGSNSELNEALRYACLAILDKCEEDPEPAWTQQRDPNQKMTFKQYQAERQNTPPGFEQVESEVPF